MKLPTKVRKLPANFNDAINRVRAGDMKRAA